MKPTRKQALYIISGASAVGKTSLCELLFQEETSYIVLDSDLLWDSYYDTPEDDYHVFRTVWMRVCASISQIGLPVVLCGCAIPQQFEAKVERELFTDIHYLAVVCSDENLRSRMEEGRKISDQAWIQSSLDFNRWLQDNASNTSPPIRLLDTSDLTPVEAAAEVDAWIKGHEGLE